MHSGDKARSWLLLGAVALAAAAWGSAAAQDRTDVVGVYFDPDFTLAILDDLTPPSFVTGYLVLHNPSAAAGVGGWELCAEIEGPAQFTSWQLEGQTVNVSTPPCFMVGIGGAALPAGQNVLLATFQMVVEGQVPVAISLVPNSHPSIPDRMCYLDGADPETILPLATTTGTDAVAWINAGTPWYQVLPQEVDFREVVLGSSVTGSVLVTNVGGGFLVLDVGLDGDCPGYSLTGTSGPITLAANQTARIDVRFAPEVLGSTLCTLELGGIVPPVPLAGVGRLPIVAGTAEPDTLDFGWVAPGILSDLITTVYNLGEVPLGIDPILSGSPGVFQVTDPVGTVTIDPGRSCAFTVSFMPFQIGDFTGILDLGEVVGQVSLLGRGTFDSLTGTAPGTVDFGQVVLGQSRLRTFPVVNTGSLDFAVTPAIPSGDGIFAVQAPGGTTILHGGDTLAVTVVFTPTAAQSYADLVTLGEPVGPVQLLGAGIAPILAWNAPTQIDFGSVALGATAERTATVTNLGNVPFTLEVAIPGPSDFQVIDGGGEHSVPPGGTQQVTVGFSPSIGGAVTGTLDLGATVPAVTLTAEGRLPVTSFVVSPDTLTLPAVAVGYPVNGTVTLANTGETAIAIDPVLVGGDPGFTLVAGSGATSVLPGAQHSVQVRFESLALGTFATTLAMGGIVPDVPVVAVNEAPDPGCTVSPTNLAFESVLIGVMETRYVTITNTGNVPLAGIPVPPTHVYFSVDTAPIQLDPGRQIAVAVRFQPLTEGFWYYNIDLGIGECANVLCSGSGIPWDWNGTGEDVAGVFFDQGYSISNFSTTSNYQIVTGYLVLQNPSAPSGMAGWEGCLDLDGDAQFLDFDIEGQYVNIETPPCFMVGIGVAPLPYAENILMASFRFMVATPWSEVLVLFGPTRRPSIEGYSAWIAWADLNQIIPMQELPGQVVVAGVNSNMVGVEAPTPLATVTAGGVDLSWQLSDSMADGCHVYRSLESGQAVRLTGDPVLPRGSHFVYTDPATDLAAGSVVHYCYTIVKDGVEQARSPEVTVTLGGRPAGLTRLLPNVPNPFNPQTEVRFELAKAGPVRIAVYDVSGRRVCTLVDESLGAGPQARIWQGRDDAGRPMPSGAYYLRLETDGRIDHRKVLLLK